MNLFALYSRCNDALSLAPPLHGIRLNIMSKHLQDDYLKSSGRYNVFELKYINDFQTQRLNMSMHVPIVSGGCKVTCHAL